MSKFAGVPEPTSKPDALLQTTKALKQNIEILTGQRTSKANAAVTWQDLVNLGLITALQIPK